MLGPLPRSLDPLPGESLPGYLLRLAHRLDLSPARAALLTGLGGARLTGIPACRMFALEPDQAEAFARTTRLSAQEVTALTLVSLAGRYPPLDPAFSGRQRQTHGIFVKENWVFSRATRYCPDCLTGDGSTIQQRHGGPWNLLWRLPVVFACPTHHRLLEHTCPACQQPVHHRTTHDSRMLPLAARSGLHPAQCRNPIPAPASNAGAQACGRRLDTRPDPGMGAHPGGDRFTFQTRLLNLLRTDGPPMTVSVGQDTTPARYFVDLRLLSCLITSSWPAARHLGENPAQARALTEHVRHTRSQIAKVRRCGRTAREIAFYDKPPLNSTTCAHLLQLADRIATAGDTGTIRKLLHPLVANAPPGMRLWTRQFLTGNGYCSPGLQTALGLEVGSQHVMKNVGIQSRRSPPPQVVRFGTQHIPAHLLPEWHAEHLAEITDVKPHLLRRAAAARLAQICVGGTVPRAAELLGIPRHASINALNVVKQQLHGQPHDTFNAAVRNLANHLNTATGLTDYGKRRDSLKTWSIPPTEWHTLTNDLPAQPVSGIVRTYTDWGDSKRLLASTWVWVRITQGEHIFAPPIRPNLNQPRPGGQSIRDIHTRWPLISDEQPTGHYTTLRERLDTYADQLAANIDKQ